MQQQMRLDTYDTAPMRPLPGETVMAYEKRMAKMGKRPNLPKRDESNVIEMNVFNRKGPPKKVIISERCALFLKCMTNKYQTSTAIIEKSGLKKGGGGYSHSLKKLVDVGLATRKRDADHGNRYFYKRITTANNGKTTK